MQPPKHHGESPFERAMEPAKSALAEYRRAAGSAEGRNPWDEPTAVRPTSIRFLDEMLGGGLVPGELYGLLGTIGGGKTMLAVQLACSMALSSYSRFIGGEDRESLGMCYLLGLEGSADALRYRAIAHSAQVYQDYLAADSPQAASCHVAPAPFETALVSSSAMPSDADRIEAVKPALGSCIKLFDAQRIQSVMRSRSISVVEALDDVIASDIAKHRHHGFAAHVEVVIVDYVGLAVELDSMRGSRNVNIAREIYRFTADMSRRVAAAHGCPVWLNHQLNSSANEADPSQSPNAFQAKDCRSFAERLDVVFTTGKKDSQDLFVFKCAKNRSRKSGQEKILRLDGPRATLREFGDDSLFPNWLAMDTATDRP